jgi:protein SCO1/2
MVNRVVDLCFRALALALAAALPAVAADGSGADQDAYRRHHIDANALTRTTVEVAVPDVELVREDGRKVHLVAEMDDGRPVLMSFVYTTCTAICPVIAQTMTELQTRLGTEREQLHMVLVSIDPEQDTPARLRDFARKFDAGPQWHFYTGATEASIAVQRSFSVYRGDKMNHTSVFFLRAAPGRPWVRLDGFASPSELLAEYRLALASAK